MDEAEYINNGRHLLNLDAPQAEAWVRKHLLDQPAAKTFNWRGFAEVGASRAHQESDLEWGRLAILSYAQLEDESAASSAMMLRAALIVKFGAVVGDNVLDPEIIIRWFLDNASLTYAEAAHMAKTWKASSKEAIPILSAGGSVLIPYQATVIEMDRMYILGLRRIKNRANVVEILIKNDVIKPSKELADWIALRQDLP